LLPERKACAPVKRSTNIGNCCRGFCAIVTDVSVTFLFWLRVLFRHLLVAVKKNKKELNHKNIENAHAKQEES
jgi:hypothetical protein